ncbi:MAG: phosphate acetyltransferase [Propionibacteriaceae bacterium]|jgi:phosphate acetyltransferase|nr:phosphate acetyltransferase [Propionibacteriaceae bacterium]
MTKSVYIAAPESTPHKTLIALKAIASLRAAGQKVGLFRPIIADDVPDACLEELLLAADADQAYQSGYGITYSELRRGDTGALTQIIDRYEQVADGFDTMVIVGSDFTGVIKPVEFSLNAKIAADLNAPVLLIAPSQGKTATDLSHAVDFLIKTIDHEYAHLIGVIGVDVDSTQVADTMDELGRLNLDLVAVFTDPRQQTSVWPPNFAQVVSAQTDQVRTPLRFQYELMRRAKSDKRTVILPETTDDRVLTAAGLVLAHDIANLILLGDRETIMNRAATLGVDLSAAKVQDPTDPELVEKFAEQYATLRAHKGMTLDKARQTLTDLSYFGTMMIYFGLADGMVSGAIHTTANTIRPSLEFIKTKPGVALVSGYFLMCLPDRVFVFADCAVTTNPTPEQLADIALASATTAEAFGIEPRVAMLSYSTGTSGTGPDVDMVRAATALLQERAHHLPAEGPIQFDAAIDPVVARTKLPQSSVAGHATVFVFPDLDTGNITYKAVQRTAHTLALGPVLQGLRKPVNDLSRGALVDDIVNTVAITAIQAQADPAAPF